MKVFNDSRVRWYLLACLWVVMLVIGIGGFIQQGHAPDIDRTLPDNLYLTFKLGTLDYDGSSGAMNWRLQMARFVVPLLAATTILQTASIVFREEFRRYRLKFAKRHTIIVGLGETGSRLAAAFAAAGETVVGIEPDATVSASSGVAQQLAHLLTGSGTDDAVLRAAGIDRAARLVVCTGTDAGNVQVARAVALHTDGRSRSALRVSVQLDDADLTLLLRAADLESRGGSRISYFNLKERAARALVSQHGPPFEPGMAPPHLMVVGLGQFGSSLVLALCQQWAEVNPGVKLCPTVVDGLAKGHWEALRLQHPALSAVCEPTLVELDLEAPDPDAIGDLLALLSQDPPTWVAIAVDDEATALANAGFVHQNLPFGQVPIVVRMRTEAGLGGLLRPHPESGSPLPGVELFPFLDRTCTIETVDGGVREQLAQAVHEDYLATLVDDGVATSLERPWGELSDADRDLSRNRVDGIVADLDAIGCDLVPLRRWGAPQVTFTDDEIETLAAREHQRWFDERTAGGWVHGDVKDEVRRTNPLLVAWTELAEPDRAWNVTSARNLLPMLARNGFEAARRGRSGAAPDPIAVSPVPAQAADAPVIDLADEPREPATSAD